jgi:hypothetical protein
LERNVDAAIPTPPNVETRRKPIDEQLAQVLESKLKEEPENSEARFTFKFFDCLNTYTFMLTTIPISAAVILERMNPVIASSGR